MPLSKQVYNINPAVAGEEYMGKVGSPADLIDVTLVLDNGVAYGSGDVMAITALLASVARVNDGKVYPYLILVTDEDDQGGAFDLLFFRSMVNIGTINNAASIDDAGSRDLLGWVSIAAADYTDFGGFRAATLNDNSAGWHMGLWEPSAGTKDIYIAAISRDTKTYTTSGLRLKISVGQN